MASTERLVRASLEAFAAGDWNALMRLLDRNFEVSSFVAPGRVLRGPDEVVWALQAARDTVYEIHVERYERLDASTALGVGSVRVPMPEGGFKHHSAAWLWTSDGACLISWHSYDSEEEARRVFSSGGPLARASGQ